MMPLAPLQVLLFRHPDDDDLLPFEDAVVRAFQGGKEVGGYVASGVDLAVQLSPFGAVPSRPADELLDDFCHTLVIVLVDRSMLEAASAASLLGWLAACWTHCRASQGRHAMFVLPMEERQAAELARREPILETLQVRAAHELGERAVRPAMFALRILHESRVLLARATPIGAHAPAEPGFLKLFISHAKLDGLPLAQALKGYIQLTGWLQKFYDAEDLPSGCDWQAELERGVGTSVIVMLRTEEYDGRYWCQQEVLWADAYATPAVLVDARTSLHHPAAGLPFDRVPIVRIPDGNLTRVLYAALREGLRFLLFARRVEELRRVGVIPSSADLRVFSLPPSMPALLRACRSWSSSAVSSATRLIVYPDPPLRAGVYEAAVALVAATAPGVRLATPNTLAATTGLVP